MSNYDGPLYEAFGASPLEFVTRMVEQEEPTDIPYAEIHEGLFRIEISVYGDSVDQRFLHVVATTKWRAAEVYEQTSTSLEHVQHEWVKSND